MGDPLTLVSTRAVAPEELDEFVRALGGATEPRVVGGDGAWVRVYGPMDSRREGLDAWRVASARLGAEPVATVTLEADRSFAGELRAVSVARAFASRWPAVAVVAMHRLLGARELDALRGAKVGLNGALLGATVDVPTEARALSLLDALWGRTPGASRASEMDADEQSLWCALVRETCSRVVAPGEFYGAVSSPAGDLAVLVTPFVGSTLGMRLARRARDFDRLVRLCVGFGASAALEGVALDVAWGCVGCLRSVAHVLVEEALDLSDLEAIEAAGEGLTRGAAEAGA
jgi:hypothetical protein